MWMLYICFSATSWIGQSAASHNAIVPSAKQTTWKRVTAGRPGLAKPGSDAEHRNRVPDDEGGDEQPDVRVSGPGGDAGGDRHAEPGSVPEAVQRADDHRIENDGGDQPEDEEAPEDRQVGLEVHVPHDDEGELDDRHPDQQRDDQAVG